MLPRSQRLSVEQLDSVMEKGRVAHSSLFLMRYTTGQESLRIAAVAPKKVIKTAVARNATRRKIYEAIKNIVGRAKNDVHVALFAKAEVTTKQTDDLENELEGLFVKAKLLR